LLAAALLVPFGPARAEYAEDKALATALFQEARALMAAKRFAEACPKLAESQRLDPSGGTLLNLALCHEQEGRLASSWSEFNEAAAVARRDARRDREQEALSHVRALEPRLSRLTIVVPTATQVEGLRIERDGREIGRGAWSTAMPIDGGAHTVRATATAREPFTATIVIEREGDAKTVEIPVLATPLVATAPSRVDAKGLLSPPPSQPMSPKTAQRMRWGGIATVGAGVALFGLAGWQLALALDAKDAATADCIGDLCGGEGMRYRSDAVSHGNWATALSVSGAVLVGGGAALYYFGWRGARARTASRADLHVSLGAAPGMVATGIAGTF
jgi:serine/threonine-protein kinase